MTNSLILQLERRSPVSLSQHFRKVLIALSLVLALTLTACGGTATTDRTAIQPGVNNTQTSGQVARGDSPQAQNFGEFVVQTSRGLVQDAYVRGGDKLGVVISPQVRPTEVRPLAKSLVQGFRQNAPDRDLTVLMYAPDKQLILTAKYDKNTNQIEYN
jgi:hypothetical protein